MISPADADVRLQAIDVSRSFLVSAPAGSGKTELLAQRVLALLAIAEEPESVLAITFTKRAQGEMLGRILNTLIRVSAGSTEGMNADSVALAKAVLARDEQKGWHIIENPSRLRIKTIDAFLGSLAGRSPLAGLMAGGLNLSDNPDACYRNAARQLMADIESDVTYITDLCAVMRHVGNDFHLAEEMFVDLLKKRDQWLPMVLRCSEPEVLRATVEESLRVVRAALIDGVTKSMSDYLPSIHSMMLFAGENMEPDSAHAGLVDLLASGGVARADIEGWKLVANWVLTSDGAARKKLTAAQGFPAASKLKGEQKVIATEAKESMELLCRTIGANRGALAALGAIRKAPPTTYTDDEWQILGALLRLLPVLAGKLQLIFAREGVVDHIAVAASALSVLGQDVNPSDTLLSLDNQIAHLLVDEFQDTSGLQVQMITRLTSGWMPGDGRTLFLVGDSKQSIYGFRGSNVGLFIDIEQRGLAEIDITTLHLSVNFRSSPVVVEWVNDVFSQALPTIDDANSGAVSFSGSTAFKSAAEDDAVRVTFFTGVDPEIVEAKSVAADIGRIRTEKPGDSIAVLVRNRSHAARVCEALRDADIGFQAVEMEPLKNRLVVRDIVTLAKALIRQHDRIAWIALLRSPLCGLSLADIEILCGDGKTLVLSRLKTIDRINGITPNGVTAVQRLLGIVLPTLDQRDRKSLRMAVEGAWLAMGGAACVTASVDINSMPAVWSVLDQLNWASSNEEFDLLLGRLYASPGAARDAQVQVMTAHKSKGLEFDHVFLPRTDKTGGASDSALLLWDNYIGDGAEYPLMSASRPYGGQDTSINTHIKHQAARRELNEAARLMYVACTRARKSLHISAVVNCTDNDEIKAPGSTSLLAQIWDAVKDSAIIVKGEYNFDAPEQPSGRMPVLQPVRVQAVRVSTDYLPATQAPLAEYRGLIHAKNEHFELDAWELSDQKAVAQTVRTLMVNGVLRAESALFGVESWLAERHDMIKALLKQFGLPGFMAAQATAAVQQQVVALSQQIVNAIGGDSTPRLLAGHKRCDEIGGKARIVEVACGLITENRQLDIVVLINEQGCAEVSIMETSYRNSPQAGQQELFAAA